MSYGHANCQKCGRATNAYPQVGEDESWVVCTECGGGVSLKDLTALTVTTGRPAMYFHTECPDCKTKDTRIAALEAENAELRRERDEFDKWVLEVWSCGGSASVNAHTIAMRALATAESHLAAPSPDAKEA